MLAPAGLRHRRSRSGSDPRADAGSSAHSADDAYDADAAAGVRAATAADHDLPDAAHRLVVGFAVRRSAGRIPAGASDDAGRGAAADGTASPGATPGAARADPMPGAPQGRRLVAPLRYRCVTMKCHRCGRPASVHVTVLAGAAYAEVHLCEACEGSARQVAPPATADPVACDRCGSTLRDIEARGRFGCANDYRIFAPQVAECLMNYHGSSTHAGKSPAFGGR
jgi:protein arginine kinase activator